MVELNSIAQIRIKKCRPYSFSLDLDTTSFKEYTRQGIVADIKVPQTISFHALSQSIKDPSASSRYGLIDADLRHIGRSQQLHTGVRALHQFHSIH